jgi:hypothetical protein
MKNNYFLSFLFLIFGLCFNSLQAQTLGIGTPDYGSATADAFPSIVIQDVLENDLQNGLPITLSDVHILQVSSTSNYLELNPLNGSVMYVNGPAPTGSYYFAYTIFSNTTQQEIGEQPVYVNIGCDAVNTPMITNVTEPTCNNAYGSFTLEGLPQGQWQIFINNQFVRSGTETSATFTNVYPGKYIMHVKNSQGCISAASAPLEFRYLNVYLTGDYVDTNADNIPSVGDSIVYHCTVTNESNCALTNVTTQGGNLMLGSPIATLDPGVTDSTTLTSTYIITQTDINAGYVSKSTTIRGTAGSISLYTNVFVSKINYFNQTNGMKLVAFIDSNGNGIQDENEPNFSYGNFTYEVNNDGTVHQIAANSACYLYETNAATSYDIGFSVYPSYASYYGLATPTISNITVPVGSGITTYYFPLTIIPYTDLAVNIYSSGVPPRPGFTYANTIQIRNAGNEIIPAGNLTFTKNIVASLVSVAPTGTVLTPTGFTYDFTALSPGEIRTLTVTMQVPTIPTVALGDLLTNSASISIPSGDVDDTNNTATITQTIVGSYDPNDKAESHGERVVYSGFSADDYLTYTIRFENTGTFPAEFVRVNDVLDAKLDETTVRMVDASHSYVLDRVDNNLTWMFDDIQLPPSVANTNIGHGYLVFQVKPKSGFILGDVIPNSADIFFDFNPAIVTNTWTTEFVSTLATKGFAFDQFKSYPNPVKHLFNISNASEMDSITITSVLGQTVLTKSINTLETTVDLSRLPKGVYFVKVTSNKEVKTIKIIKE